MNASLTPYAPTHAPPSSRIIIPYAPRPLQLQIHRALETHRWAVIVIHRRFGKTVLLINEMIKKALTCPLENPRYLYLAPFRNQAKKIAWDYLKKYTAVIPGVKVNETELRVDLPNGARLYLDGADNAEAHRGIYLDGVVLDEYAQIDPKIFTSVLRPALSDRLGWCVFSGTPNGRNHFFKELEYARSPDGVAAGYYWIVLKASETGYVIEAELTDARRKLSEGEYACEYECSFDFIIGKRIYPEFSHNLHVSYTPLIPTTPTTIYRGWDNTGLSPAIALTYITNTGQWRVFKEFCFSDCSITTAVEEMTLWCNQNLPNGCRFIDYADPAGKNRDSSKMSPRDYIVLKSRELGQEIWPEDGIQTWKIRRESVAGRLTRVVNGEPAILIDNVGCPKLIEGFAGAYAYRELKNLPGQYVEEAVKNDVSHIHDALQYPATRLFMNTSSMMTAGKGYLTNVISLEDAPNYGYDPYGYEQSGRSAIGGY